MNDQEIFGQFEGQSIQGEPISFNVHHAENPSENRHASESNSDDESDSAKMLKTLCRDCETSGDWKDVTRTTKTRAILHADPDRTTTNTSEWKSRNLYSVSNSNHYSHWSTRCAGLTESLRRELEKEEKENILHNFREYLASYQEAHGIPRTEYSFAALVRVMGQATGRSLLALLYIVINIAPVAEIFVHILRFMLDKMIDILNTTDRQQVVVKYFVFGLQLLSIYICLVFIFGFFVTPIIRMVIGILAKILLHS